MLSRINFFLMLAGIFSLTLYTPTANANHSDDQVMMNQIQTIGTHNSYKLMPPPKILNLIDWIDRELGQSIRYQHAPIQYQLNHQRIRQVELDVFDDPQGGLFASRKGLFLVGENPESRDQEMYRPGIKVLHFPDFDYQSNCLTLVRCLRLIKSWSAQNPYHTPVLILIEAKHRSHEILQRLGFTTPKPLTVEFLDRIDSEILSVFPKEHIISPDNVRKTSPNLNHAVLTNGWPSLTESRGKLIFALDNTDKARSLYTEGHPSLAGRVMFTSAPPGEAEAAFVKMNLPTGSNQKKIQDLVRSGYLVRTRADADTIDQRENSEARFRAALQSGAQYISTDYPDPVPGYPYKVRLPGDYVARCNPVSAENSCRSETIEP